jgi:hypothetical protein
MRHRRPIEVNFIPVDGDPIQTIADALWPRVSRVLHDHGATLHGGIEGFVQILRKNSNL